MNGNFSVDTVKVVAIRQSRTSSFWHKRRTLDLDIFTFNTNTQRAHSRHWEWTSVKDATFAQQRYSVWTAVLGFDNQCVQQTHTLNNLVPNIAAYMTMNNAHYDFPELLNLLVCQNSCLKPFIYYHKWQKRQQILIFKTLEPANVLTFELEKWLTLLILKPTLG